MGNHEQSLYQVRGSTKGTPQRAQEGAASRKGHEGMQKANEGHQQARRRQIGSTDVLSGMAKLGDTTKK
ncbi:MAG: hypothetical protein WC340_11570 [Kiritimatiellia bacterium]